MIQTTARPGRVPDGASTEEPQDLRFYRRHSALSTTDSETRRIEGDSDLYARLVTRLTSSAELLVVEDLIQLEE